MNRKKKTAGELSDLAESDSVISRIGQTREQIAKRLTTNIADTVRTRNVHKMGFILDRRG